MTPSHIFRNDGQADETELATRIMACPACDAPAGQGCRYMSDGSYSDVYAEPHAGRVELLRALKRYVNVGMQPKPTGPVRPPQPAAERTR